MRSREEVEFFPDDDLTKAELARRQADNAARDAAAEASNAPTERHWPEGVDPLTMPLKDQNSNQ